MLTGNRKLVDAMLRSPDAIEFLRRSCEQRGCPIKYVVFVKKPMWLAPSADLKSIVYYNPHTYPRLEPIGGLKFQNGPLEVLRRDGKVVFAIWSMTGARGSTGTSRSPPSTILTALHRVPRAAVDSPCRFSALLLSLIATSNSLKCPTLIDCVSFTTTIPATLSRRYVKKPYLQALSLFCDLSPGTCMRLEQQSVQYLPEIQCS